MPQISSVQNIALSRRAQRAAFESSIVAAVRPFRLPDAFIGVPAILILLATAVLPGGHDVASAIAAGAAYSVGFGAPRRIFDQPWASMVGATVTMAVATALGSLLGHSPLALIAASGLVAGACGWLALYDEEHWWVVLQAAIALFVAGYFAGSPEQAALRTGLVLTGGLVQTGFVLVLRHFIVPPHWASVVKTPPRAELVVQHIVSTAAAVMLAALAASLAHLSNAYWAPMTALIVLKPGLRETSTRGFYRLAGTIVGCLAAGVVAVTLPPGSSFLALALAGAAGLSYALQKANYALFTSAVTAAVVFLLALGHEPEMETSEHRIIATALGGGIALGIAALVRTHHYIRRRPRRDTIR